MTHLEMALLVMLGLAVLLALGFRRDARDAERWQSIYEAEQRISAKWLAITAELMRRHDPDQYCRLVSQLSRRGLPIPERICAKYPMA